MPRSERVEAPGRCPSTSAGAPVDALPRGDFSLDPISVPRFWEANLPRSYILCLQDRAKPRWMSDEVARRLGVDPISIGASHSPFPSRPRELAELLVHATTTARIGPRIAN